MESAANFVAPRPTRDPPISKITCFIPRAQTVCKSERDSVPGTISHQPQSAHCAYEPIFQELRSSSTLTAHANTVRCASAHSAVQIAIVLFINHSEQYSSVCYINKHKISACRVCTITVPPAQSPQNATWQIEHIDGPSGDFRRQVQPATTNTVNTVRGKISIPSRCAATVYTVRGKCLSPHNTIYTTTVYTVHTFSTIRVSFVIYATTRNAGSVPVYNKVHLRLCEFAASSTAGSVNFATKCLTVRVCFVNCATNRSADSVSIHSFLSHHGQINIHSAQPFSRS